MPPPGGMEGRYCCLLIFVYVGSWVQMYIHPMVHVMPMKAPAPAKRWQPLQVSRNNDGNLRLH